MDTTKTAAKPCIIPRNTNNNKHFYHICNRKILELDNTPHNMALNTIKMINDTYTPKLNFDNNMLQLDNNYHNTSLIFFLFLLATHFISLVCGAQRAPQGNVVSCVVLR